MQTRSENVAVPGALHAYPFLAQPPAHKKRATHDALGESNTASPVQHSRRRSLAAISDWASNVQPGPPAPLSPASKAKFAESSHSSSTRSGRRHSVQPVPPSPVAYLPESPSSSSNGTITPKMPTEEKARLHTVGYTSVFVSLPRSPKEERMPDGRQAIPPTPTSAVPAGASESKRGLNRFRTLSLKPRAKTTSDAPREKSTKEKKKSKYDGDRPALLATDLALAQLMGGGTIEHHMRQAEKKEAKRNGAKKVDGQLVGVAPLHCDERGRVWRDQDEEWEYEHLLGAGRAEDPEWVRFDEARARRRSESTSNSDDSRDAFHPSSRSNKSKHRPKPLNLAPPPRSHTLDTVDARRDFLESSFAPSAPPTASLEKRSGLKLKSMFGGKKNRS